MATIGIIDIGMKASVGPFLEGIGKARKSLASFVTGAGSAGLDKLDKGIHAIGGGAKRIASDLLNVKTVAIATAGGIAGITAALTALTIGSLGTVDAQGKLADRLGVSGASLAQFTHAVNLSGGPVEQLPEILGKLNGTLGQAARGAGPAAASFRRLGLDAQALAKAGPIEATKQIAERLKGIASPADKAATAVAIFGEQGLKLLGTLNAGGDGIAAMEADAKRLGMTLEATDYAKVANANDALSRVGASIQGIGDQLAVQLAPYIDVAANKLADLATTGGGAGPIVAKGIGIATSAAGYLGDSIATIRTGFLGAQSIATAFGAKVVGVFSAIENGIVATLNLIPGIEARTDGTLAAVAADLDKLASDQFASFQEALAAPPPSAAIAGFFDGIADSATNSAEAIVATAAATNGLGEALGDTALKVADLESKLQDQIATVGLSAHEIEIYRLEQDGATAADLSRLRALADQADAADRAAKAQEKLADEAKSVTEATRSPLEKLIAEQDKLAKLLDSGLIDRATFDRATSKLGVGTEAGKGDGEKHAGALEAGSKEARSTILAFRNSGAATGEDAQRKTAANTDAIARATIDTAAILRKAVATAATAVGDLLQI